MRPHTTDLLIGISLLLGPCVLPAPAAEVFWNGEEPRYWMLTATRGHEKFGAINGMLRGSGECEVARGPVTGPITRRCWVSFDREQGYLTAGDALAGPCPRPSDQYGPRYETIMGVYQSRRVSPGGGKFVTIMPRNGAALISINVTDKVFDVAGSLVIGTGITLVSYVRDSLSGARPPYACIELAH